MIISQMLIEIIGHAGVKDSIHTLFQKGKHMAMHQFGGKANGIAGDGALPFYIEFPVG